MSNLPHHAADDERELLERAASYPDYREFSDLDDEAVRQITRREGVDFATALLFDRLVRSADHGSSIQRIHAYREPNSELRIPADVLFAIVPGALYTEHPENGADGFAIRAAAERLGCRTELIPLPTMGLPSENAGHLCDWLQSRDAGERIILISLSKGGADVKAALARSDAGQTFDRVIAWISVSGTIDGVPLANWGLRRPLALALWRSIFWWRGWNFRFVYEMKFNSATRHASDLRLPGHMRLIHAVGFPLKRHVSAGYPRRWFRRLAPRGPNDSVSMLLDVCRLPGLVLPVWGSDHYLATHAELEPFVNSVVCYLADECDLTCRHAELEGAAHD